MKRELYEKKKRKAFAKYCKRIETVMIYLFIGIFACTGKNCFNINFDKSKKHFI